MRILHWGVIGVAGIFILGGGYMAWSHFSESEVHLHANFHIYADGERLDLTDDKYMTDVSKCVPDIAPLTERVHLHEGIDTVVHVHAEGITWDIFLESLGFEREGESVSFEGALYERVQVYTTEGTEGQSYLERVIEPHEQIAIILGNAPEKSPAEILELVPHDAHHFDGKSEVGCGG